MASRPMRFSFALPRRAVALLRHERFLLMLSAVILFNLTCVIHAGWQRLSLRDTGKHLAHMEHQLRQGPTISNELTARIRQLGDQSGDPFGDEQ